MEGFDDTGGRMPRADVSPLRIPRSDGAEIAAEIIGPSRHPLVLLVAGGESSMDWWRPEFCDLLVDRGLRVARYDQRGMGETTLGPVGSRRDGLAVAVGDALAVLDAAGAREAHWVGFSAGGWVCQLAALDHADQVLSLTLVSTTPSMFGDADLPGPAARLREAWANPHPDPDWDDPEAVIEHHVEIDRNYAGDEFDEAHDRAIWADTVRRSPGMHRDKEGTVEFEGAPGWRERLGEIRVPTTVVHGTSDPMFPIGNGEALARSIPGARLVKVPGGGHELPPSAWPFVVEAVAGA